MKKMQCIVVVVFSMLLLTACAKDTLKTPCPNFGAHCRKVPINVWDYQS